MNKRWEISWLHQSFVWVNSFCITLLPFCAWQTWNQILELDTAILDGTVLVQSDATSKPVYHPQACQTELSRLCLLFWQCLGGGFGFFAWKGLILVKSVKKQDFKILHGSSTKLEWLSWGWLSSSVLFFWMTLFYCRERISLFSIQYNAFIIFHLSLFHICLFWISRYRLSSIAKVFYWKPISIFYRSAVHYFESYTPLPSRGIEFQLQSCKAGLLVLWFPAITWNTWILYINSSVVTTFWAAV